MANHLPGRRYGLMVVFLLLLSTSVSSAHALDATTPSSAHATAPYRTLYPIYEKHSSGINGVLNHQNLGDGVAVAAITAMDLQSGALYQWSVDQIPPLGSFMLDAGNFPSLPPGSYALTVDSDQPHTGVTSIYGPDHAPSLAAYTGIEPPSAAGGINPWGAFYGPYYKGAGSSTLRLWNTAQVPATTSIQLFALNGVSVSSVLRTIPAERQITVASTEIASLAAGAYLAVVSSDLPLVGLLETEGGAFPLDQDMIIERALDVRTNSAVLSRVVKDVAEEGGGRSSTLFVSNAGTEATHVAISFYDAPGGSIKTLNYAGVPPLGGLLLDLDTFDDLPSGAYAVRVDAAQPVGIAEHTSYRGPTDTVVAAHPGVVYDAFVAYVLSLPRVVSSASTRTRFSIMNNGDATATVMVEYYGPSGSHVPTPGSYHSLPPMGTVRVDPAAHLPDEFWGSAVVAADQPVSIRIDEYWTQPCDVPTDALITVTPSGPVDAGMTLTFTVSADGTPPRDYAWDFSDGHEATGPTVLHSFATPGTYEVAVVVANACGSTSASHSVEVMPVYTDYIYLPLVNRR